MELNNPVLIRTAIFILGLCGLWVARHIYQNKKAKRPLVCPIRFDCNTVVNSDYSRFFGVPLEVLGMTYYAVVVISYFLLVVMNMSLSNTLSAFLATISGLAFLFSLYLICVQVFILKKGCSWCFVSAFISILIFILTLTLY